MGRILILSNKADLSNRLKQNIESQTNSVLYVGFPDAVEAIVKKNPDILLVDLIIQGSIVELWRKLRYDLENIHKPALVLISEDRIREIELLEGISDFIVYPYNSRELEMRVKLLLKRYERGSTERFIKIGNIVIDQTKYEVTVDGWPLVLTLKEYELLKYLSTHPGRVFTREVLLDQIWGYDYYGGTRTVDVHIGRLRTKIETGDYSFIKTVRGVGYTFTENHVAKVVNH